MTNTNWLDRTEKLIGKENLSKLKNSNIVVFGLGGVGSYVVEGLVRSGIENIAIIDKDIVDVTNINRQIIANINTIDLPKVKVEADRISHINPNTNIIEIQEFISKDNILEIMNKINHQFNKITKNPYINLKESAITYVIDAIDTVSSKLEIIKYCSSNNIHLISCMGTGNKLDASKFEIADIAKTSVCPLAKVIRKELKKMQIPHLKVLYSKEEPIKTESSSPASISFVPSVAGLLIASEVVKDIINCNIGLKR